VEYKIILFDGVCNLCNGLVNFIIDHDKKKIFKFASLQSESAIQLLESNRLQIDVLESIILIDSDIIKTKSSAVIEISRHLDGIWSALSWFIFIPAFIRDFFYDLVAKYRYSIFGKTTQCRLPESELVDRFL